MDSVATAPCETQALLACTVSRNVRQFASLLEDMETALGDRWGDLGLSEAADFLTQPSAAALVFIVVAVARTDAEAIDEIAGIVATAKSIDLKVILVAEDLEAAQMQRLLREGGDEFVPYPLADGTLAAAVDRVLAPPEDALAVSDVGLCDEPKRPTAQSREGVVIAIQGMAGGTGCTTFAVNLAWELTTLESSDEPPRVCLIDLDFQFGATATYLDLPRREAVFELLSDLHNADAASFAQALERYDDRLHVLTPPTDMIPLDLVGPADIAALLKLARTDFDYVVIDMPSAMVEWSQTVLETSHVYFAVLELDMRCAQNVVRLKRTLHSEELPFDKLRFVLNRAPGLTDLSGKARVRRLADSLGISVEVQLPQGGKQVPQLCDHGTPLAVGARKNALRREIAKLAASIHAVHVADTAKAVRKG